MNKKPFISGILVFCVITMHGVIASACAQQITITGTVKNMEGKPISGAKVSLVKGNISTTTNTDGAYALSGDLTIIPSAKNSWSGRMRLSSRGISFSIIQKSSAARIATFDVRGKLVATVVDKELKTGQYTFNPFPAALAHGIYCVSVKIGNDETRIAAPNFSHRNTAISPGKSFSFQSSSAFSKSVLPVDNLLAGARGYQTMVQAISSYSGIFNFTLPSDSALPYYRLRIEYLNAGDWSTVSFLNSAKIIKTRIMSSSGKPTIIGANTNQLSLNQTYTAVDTTRMTVDCALTPSALDSLFPMRMQKGGAGRIILRIYTVVGTTVQLVKEVNESGQLTFSIDLSSLKTTSPWLAPMANVPKMGLALYYPWYYMGSWTSNQLVDHPATFYDSGDTLAIARQMDQAKGAGITGFLVSWAGPSSDSDKKLKLLLKVAQKKDFKIGIFFELLENDGPRNVDTVYNWFSYLVSTYRDNPALLTVNRKPIAVPFCTQLFGFGNWKRVLDRLHAVGLDPAVLCDRDPGDSLFMFEGVCCSPSNSLGQKLRYYSVLADSPAAKIYCATAMPGFDERLVPGRTGRFEDRQNGQLFTTRLQEVIASNPNWVEAYTWNEWWENTYVEPSVNYGDQYLQIFGSIVKPWLAQ